MAPSKKKAPLTKALIHEVQDHPAIWDKRSKDYKNIVASANAWQEILSNLEETFSKEQLSDNNLSCIEDIKSHWQNLRKVYGQKKARGTSGAGKQFYCDKIIGKNLADPLLKLGSGGQLNQSN